MLLTTCATKNMNDFEQEINLLLNLATLRSRGSIFLNSVLRGLIRGLQDSGLYRGRTKQGAGSMHG
jgi:hypothetical protein